MADVEHNAGKRLAGKTALITGAASGIGRAIALTFAAEGARVVVADIDDPGGRAVAKQLRDNGCAADFLLHDVSSESSWEQVRKCFQKSGCLDILVNAAGVFARQGHPVNEVTFEEWRRIMSVNLDGVFLGTRFGVDVMKDRKRGSIVNIGSVAGVGGSRGGIAYGASKGGVHILSKQAAFSCAKSGYGIRVNCILPGYVWTAGTQNRAIAQHGSEEAARKALAARHPLNLPIEAEDIALAAVYLASDDARAVTGTELVVDGGLLATLWGVS